MSKQWGYGFHKGKEHGEHWGAMYEGGKWEIELSKTTARLHLLINALRLPVEHKSGRTETWWQLYVSAAANELEEITRTLPGTLNGVYEFEKDIPQDETPNDRVQASGAQTLNQGTAACSASPATEG